MVSATRVVRLPLTTLVKLKDGKSCQIHKRISCHLPICKYKSCSVLHSAYSFASIACDLGNTTDLHTYLWLPSIYSCPVCLHTMICRHLGSTSNSWRHFQREDYFRLRIVEQLNLFITVLRFNYLTNSWCSTSRLFWLSLRFDQGTVLCSVVCRHGNGALDWCVGRVYWAIPQATPTVAQ